MEGNMIIKDDLIRMKKLSETVEKEICERLITRGSPISAIFMINGLHSIAEKIVTDVKKKGARFNCKSGCNDCCSFKVEVLGPEAFYIARKLKSVLSIEEAGLLVESLEKYIVKAKNYEGDTHAPTCPMLKEGLCSIYDFRPLVCRRLNSYSVEYCKSPSKGIPQNSTILLYFEVFSSSYMKALQSCNLPADFHDFVPALLIALTDDDAEIKWSKGHAVFDFTPDAEF